MMTTSVPLSRPPSRDQHGRPTIAAVIQRYVPQPSALRALYLERLGLHRLDLTALGPMPNLEVLSVAHNQLTALPLLIPTPHVSTAASGNAMASFEGPKSSTVVKPASTATHLRRQPQPIEAPVPCFSKLSVLDVSDNQLEPASDSWRVIDAGVFVLLFLDLRGNPGLTAVSLSTSLSGVVVGDLQADAPVAAGISAALLWVASINGQVSTTASSSLALQPLRRALADVALHLRRSGAAAAQSRLVEQAAGCVDAAGVHPRQRAKLLSRWRASVAADLTSWHMCRRRYRPAVMTTEGLGIDASSPEAIFRAQHEEERAGVLEFPEGVSTDVRCAVRDLAASNGLAPSADTHTAVERLTVGTELGDWIQGDGFEKACPAFLLDFMVHSVRSQASTPASEALLHAALAGTPNAAARIRTANAAKREAITGRDDTLAAAATFRHAFFSRAKTPVAGLGREARNLEMSACSVRDQKHTLTSPTGRPHSVMSLSSFTTRLESRAGDRSGGANKSVTPSLTATATPLPHDGVQEAAADAQQQDPLPEVFHRAMSSRRRPRVPLAAQLSAHRGFVPARGPAPNGGAGGGKSMATPSIDASFVMERRRNPIAATLPADSTSSRRWPAVGDSVRIEHPDNVVESFVVLRCNPASGTLTLAARDVAGRRIDANVDALFASNTETDPGVSSRGTYDWHAAFDALPSQDSRARSTQPQCEPSATMGSPSVRRSVRRRQRMPTLEDILFRGAKMPPSPSLPRSRQNTDAPLNKPAISSVVLRPLDDAVAANTPSAGATTSPNTAARALTSPQRRRGDARRSWTREEATRLAGLGATAADDMLDDADKTWCGSPSVRRSVRRRQRMPTLEDILFRGAKMPPSPSLPRSRQNTDAPLNKPAISSVVLRPLDDAVAANTPSAGATTSPNTAARALTSPQRRRGDARRSWTREEATRLAGLGATAADDMLDDADKTWCDATGGLPPAGMAYRCAAVCHFSDVPASMVVRRLVGELNKSSADGHTAEVTGDGRAGTPR
jgi:hypothetical protein